MKLTGGLCCLPLPSGASLDGILRQLRCPTDAYQGGSPAPAALLFSNAARPAMDEPRSCKDMRKVDIDESDTLDAVEMRKLVRKFQEKDLLIATKTALNPKP